ncbi:MULTISPECIES: T9SS type A sorting domain-containing protein [unclassified Polaribacter]|nr:T9SS type A sorting domain-containing protein [Polaribacter sp. IC063]TXD56479.1 T9SS type A sorting domain-containing protein [Polaribacter sp. IC066]
MVTKNNTFSVTNLNTGIYFIRIVENNNKITTRKLIVN